MEGLRAVIIGCGAIAGGYNERASVTGTFSHAAAYRSHAGFKIVACVEPDRARRSIFMEHWSIAHGFDDVAALFASGLTFDVASICAPTSQHEPLLIALADEGIRGVFCEKPMTADIHRTRAIADRYRVAGVPLVVNYTRRWNPSIQELAVGIAEDRFGSLLSGIAIYDRGVLHHGSHMIDLIQMLVGPVQLDRVLAARAGHTPDDPLCDAVVVTTRDAPISLVGVEAGSMGVFELQLVFEKAAVALEDFSRNIRIRPATPEPLNPERMRLADAPAVETRWPEALEHAFAEFHDAVCNGTDVSSDGVSAVAAEALCDEIRGAAISSTGPIRDLHTKEMH